jgi:peptide/nickel transport system permease protein
MSVIVPRLGIDERPRSPGNVRWGTRRTLVRVCRRSASATIGGIIVGTIIMVALFASVIAPYDPATLDVLNRLNPPTWAHPFGTDNLGRDVLSRVLFGARLSLLIGGLVVAISGALGTLIGVLAGYHTRLDRFLMRMVDGLMAFPGILLAIALMAATGQRLENVVVALTAIFTPRMARVVRAVVLSLRETEFVQAGRALGATDWRIIRVHVLPNARGPMIVQGTFIFAESVLAEAALDFLGAGLPPDVPTWGTVIAAGRMFLQRAPWITVFPGAAIMLTVLGLNLLGDGLRDLADPRLRKQGRAGGIA